MNVLGWLWYIVVQLVMTVFMVIGWLLLIPFCLAHAWTDPTRQLVPLVDGRLIDQWQWRPLNWVYGNPQDGVSGQRVLIWTAYGQIPYMPEAPIWWRAYCWSAWRNSTDGLKYFFAWSNGPQATILGYKVGWWPENGKKVPLL